MATSALVPVEEYLATSYDPDVEYADGELVERNVGDVYHSRLQMLISSEFRRLEQTREVLALTECRMLVLDAPPKTRYRVPDVCLVRLPFEERVGPLTRTVPLIVVEVLSSADALSDVLDKCFEYQRRGVPHIWIVDPRGRVMVFQGTTLEVQQAGNIYIPELTEEIRFSEIFAELWKNFGRIS
jgi:Uma2 family endonuclease